MDMDLYEREVKVIMENGGVERLKNQYMVLSKHLDIISRENKGLKEKISKLESELSIKEDLLKLKNALCEEEPVKINLNDIIKVKLTPYGTEVYYHQYDETNKMAGKTVIEPHMPEIDKDGYTKFQLHHFVNLYGEHIRMCNKNVIDPLDIILCD